MKGCEMEKLTHVLSEGWNLRTKRLVFCKCLIYRRVRFISWPTNICQGCLPILKPMNFLRGFWLDHSPLKLLVRKYIPPHSSMELPTASFSQIMIPLLFLNKLKFRSFLYFLIEFDTLLTCLLAFASLFKLTALWTILPWGDRAEIK